MTIVVFNPATFKVQYPEFSAVSDSALGFCFDQAGLYLSNANNSPVQNIARRTLLLNMLTAHIASINGKLNDDGLPSAVGRVSTAAEGTVEGSLEYMAPGSQAWFVQTQYGAAFWQATTSLRGFKYIPQATRY